MSFSLNRLYRVVGVSRQAVAQHQKRQAIFNRRLELLVMEASELREQHPGCGVEKMYHTLRPDFIGRDKFIEIFMDLGFRLNRKRNYKRTTFGQSFAYPNLIKGMIVSGPSQLWQSDITYLAVGDSFLYAVFIIDVYTKKIVGYQITDNMRTAANIKALRMALVNNQPPLIHHSDRGSQYGSKEYTQYLLNHKIHISMAKSAQDNAFAERINKTIKEEYLDHWKPAGIPQMKRCLKNAVEHYNTKRLHDSLNKLTPLDFEAKWRKNEIRPKPIMTIFNNENN